MSEAPSTAALVAESIVASGSDHIFAYPGDPIIELMEQSRSRGLDVVLARREGSAAFMAEAFAMATGSVGVCLSTLGPGSTALVNGVAAATADRVPMLAISGQIETAREQYFTHQVVDHKLLFTPITKWAGRIEPTSAGTVLRKALRLAAAERPGAVHLTIAGDSGKLPATDASFQKLPETVAAETIAVHRVHGSPDPMALLESARHPILLAGIGATRGIATDALVRFAETISLPVVVSPMAKGVFPEEHSLFGGVLDMACNQVVWDLLASSDLVVAAGFDAVELIKPWRVEAPVLHIDNLANTDQIYRSDVECVGNIAATLTWLSESWKGQPRWEEDAVADHRRTLRSAYYAGRVEGDLNPTDVVDEIRAAMPRNALATTDVGSHKLLVGQGWVTHAPRELLMTNGLSSMGFGVPAAIAAQMAFPDRPVVAMVGDGGFAMTASEVSLAVARNLPVIFVVFVDGSLNRIELKQMAQSYPSTATRIEDTDLVKLADAMGARGVRVTSQKELARALDQVGSLDGPLVVEARVNPSQYESQF